MAEDSAGGAPDPTYGLRKGDVIMFESPETGRRRLRLREDPVVDADGKVSFDVEDADVAVSETLQALFDGSVPGRVDQ